MLISLSLSRNTKLVVRVNGVSRCLFVLVTIIFSFFNFAPMANGMRLNENIFVDVLSVLLSAVWVRILYSISSSVTNTTVSQIAGNCLACTLVCMLAWIAEISILIFLLL